MSGSENLYRPSADVSQEKTEAAIKSLGQHSKTDTAKNASANCDAMKKLPIVENPIHNTSPNATNIQD